MVKQLTVLTCAVRAFCPAGSAQVALPTNPLFAIEAVPFLSRFDAAVKAAGLDKTLSADTFEGTVFVPVDLVSAGQGAPASAAVMLLKCLTNCLCCQC